jgi:serine/threonine-protein kinase
MPPLQAPPEDDDWYADGDRPDGRNRRRTWAWLGVALVLVLLLGGGAWYLLTSGDRGDDGTSADPTTSSVSTSADPADVVLDPAAYVGRPVEDVRAELEEAGLVVLDPVAADATQLAAAGQPLDAGDVADLSPTGTVRAETEVTLYVAEDAYAPEEDDEEEEPPAPETSAAPSTPPSSAPSTPPSKSPTGNDTGAGTSTSTRVEQGTSGPPEPTGGPSTPTGTADPEAAEEDGAP